MNPKIKELKDNEIDNMLLLWNNIEYQFMAFCSEAPYPKYSVVELKVEKLRRENKNTLYNM